MGAISDQIEAAIRERCITNLQLVGELVVDDTKQAASRRTGALADSVGIDSWADNGTNFSTTIRATADYAEYQDVGTGVFGPEGTRIYPTKPGGVLAFDWPAAGGVVFFRSVAGSPGTHFFTASMPDRFRSAMLASF